MPSSPGASGGGGMIPWPKKYYCFQCNRHVDIVPPPPSVPDEIFCPGCGNGFLQESMTPPQSNPSGSTSAADSAVVGSEFHDEIIDPTALLHNFFADLQLAGSNFQSLATLESHGGGALRRTDDSAFLDVPGVENTIDQFYVNDRPDRNGAPPASQSAIDGLPDLNITEQVLDSDSAPCAVCKDSFKIGEKAKRMPCKHIYHSDCILPWLQLHNTCPSCRFELPADDDQGRNNNNSNGGGFGSILFNNPNTFFPIPLWNLGQNRLLMITFPTNTNDEVEISDHGASEAAISENADTNDEAVQQHDNSSGATKDELD